MSYPRNSDNPVYINPFKEIMRKEDNIIDIFVALIVGTVGSVIATYLVRLIDKLIHKNDRHSPKHGH